MSSKKYDMDSPIRDMSVVRLTWENGETGVWVVPAVQTELFRAALHHHIVQDIGIRNIEAIAIPGEGLVRDLRLVRVHGPDGLETDEVLPSSMAAERKVPADGQAVEVIVPISFKSHWWSCPDRSAEGALVLDFLGSS